MYKFLIFKYVVLFIIHIIITIIVRDKKGNGWAVAYFILGPILIVLCFVMILI